MLQSKIICLCGSTKFKKEFELINFRETMKGNIVLSVGVFKHHDKVVLSEKEIDMLNELHENKIVMSDYVYIISPNGYIGDGTKRKIEFAIKRRISIHDVFGKITSDWKNV